jgi:ferredoxin-like protein FixX
MPVFMPQQTPNTGLSNMPGDTEDAINNQTEAGELKIEAEGIYECHACNNRYYQDQSSDGGVSMQAPTRLSIAEAPSAVMGHEREHQFRDRMSAEASGREVVYGNVQVHTSLCGECGRVYVSGGKSTTVTRAKDDGHEHEQDTPMTFAEAFSTLG